MIDRIGELVWEPLQTKIDSDIDLLHRSIEWVEKSYLTIKGKTDGRGCNIPKMVVRIEMSEVLHLGTLPWQRLKLNTPSQALRSKDGRCSLFKGRAPGAHKVATDTCSRDLFRQGWKGSRGHHWTAKEGTNAHGENSPISYILKTKLETVQFRTVVCLLGVWRRCIYPCR